MYGIVGTSNVKLQEQRKVARKGVTYMVEIRSESSSVVNVSVHGATGSLFDTKYWSYLLRRNSHE